MLHVIASGRAPWGFLRAKKRVSEMAIKKIGAIIALDGEKEFKQNVTSCNKSLSALKSEMSLVKAECEGQQNSLESLTRQHEVLSKMLDEQKRKEEEVRKGLEHARASYDKVAAGLKSLNDEQEQHRKKLEELQGEYQDATDRLEAMEKAGNASERAMTKQRAVVDALSASVKEEQEAVLELDTAINKGNKTYQTAGNRVKDWETKLNTAQAQVIKASAAVNKNAAYMKEAENATDGCATSIDQFGKEVKKATDITIGFVTTVKMNLINTLTDGVKGAVSSSVSSVLDMESAQRQLQASTGATAAEMRQYQAVLSDMHAESYGQDISDLAQAMALVKQYTGEIDSSSLKEMTEDGIAMRDVFGMDLSETIRGVDALMENMGLTADEAFDLMARGAQNGLDRSGELADNIAEYSQLWAQAGFSAQEMFAILDNGLNSGAYNLDKVNDFVKEFGVSLSDGRIEENLDSFSAGTRNLFEQWKAGEATTKEVFYSVINDLANAENQQQALTVASNTWSALGEDNAMKVITSLNKTNAAYENVYGTMEDIQNVKYDTLERRIQTLGRKVQTELAEPITEKALPAIEEGLDLVIDNMDVLIPLLEGAVVGVATFKALSTAVNVYESATKGAAVAQAALNAVQNLNPAVAVATALATATVAVASYADSLGEASKESQMMAEANQRVCDSANDVAGSTRDTIASYRDSAAEMQAQAQYADILAGRITELADGSSITAEKQQVLAGYISQLNELVPDLNLAYDAQTNTLNKTNREIEDYISLSQEKIAMQAAEEYAIDLLKQRSELEIEAIKLANESNSLKAASNELLEDENYAIVNSPISAWLNGKSDERKTYEELTEAQEANQEATQNNQAAQSELEAEIEAVTEYLGQYGITLDVATGQVQGNTAAVGENSAAIGENASAQAAASEEITARVQSIADSYGELKSTVTDTLESQMNMFEEFNSGTQLSTEQLLANMQSQIDGVTNWADNLSALSDRAINQDLLQHLAEMGPEGAGYVATFASMTDEELQKASDMWAQSLDMKSGVEESVSGMFDSVTTALNGGKEVVAAAFQQAGIDISGGLCVGIREGIADGKIAAYDAGKETADAVGEGAQTHSPSAITTETGRNIVQGVAVGMENGKAAVLATAVGIGQEIASSMNIQMDAGTYQKIGQAAFRALASGIGGQKGNTVSTARLVAEAIRKETSNRMQASYYTAIGRTAVQGLESGIRGGTPMAVSAAAALASEVYASGQNIPSLYSAGYNLAMGMASGIRSGQSSVINAVADMCAAAVSTARSRLKIHSPSGVFEDIGELSVEGYEKGWENRIADVNRMIQDTMRYSAPSQHVEAGAGYGQALFDGGKLVLELPIYVGKTYSRTEIVEIAIDGISRRQNGRMSFKGVNACV